MRANSSMIRPRKSSSISKSVGIALLAAGMSVSGVSYAETPEGAAAETAPPPPAASRATSGAVKSGATAGVVKAGRHLTKTRYASSRTATKRTHRRRQPAPLRLPAVTQYGIPRLHVTAAYVIDASTNRVLFQKNPDRALPIASLSKLMTAMVFLRTNPDWDRVIEMVPEDIRNSSKTRLHSHEEISVRDLMHASLMSSDNAATKALVRTCGLPRDEFIRRMNVLADSIGLTSAHFVEPTGLSEQNVATAQDVALMLNAAAKNDIVSAITQKPSYEFTSNRRTHMLVNTDRLLRSDWNVRSGKTGFIHESGYCLATNVLGPNGTAVTAVVLGAPSNALRFAEARRILDWTFRFGLALPAARPDND